jgi:hypothetical protein
MSASRQSSTAEISLNGLVAEPAVATIEKQKSGEADSALLLLVSMKAGWLSSAVRVPAVRGRERSGGGEQRSSLSRLFNVEDRAKWEARSGGAFPKRAVRRLDENGRLPERRAGCG